MFSQGISATKNKPFSKISAACTKILRDWTCKQPSLRAVLERPAQHAQRGRETAATTALHIASIALGSTRKPALNSIIPTARAGGDFTREYVRCKATCSYKVCKFSRCCRVGVETRTIRNCCESPSHFGNGGTPTAGRR